MRLSLIASHPFGEFCYAYLHYCRHKRCKDPEECKIEDGKLHDIRCAFAGVMLHVFTEGDKARKRRDKRSRTADVHAHKKLSVVLRELRQQNSRGNVADDLARHHAEKKCALFKKDGEKVAYDADARHISRKDKEEYKCEKEGIIHHLECLAVSEDKAHGNYEKSDLIGNSAEYYRDSESEESKVEHASLRVELGLFLIQLKRLCLHENETAHGNKHDGEKERRCHDRHKLTRGNAELSVEVQILRIAEGREHTAEVCGNILHNERERHILGLARSGQHEVSERQERKQCHIVCDKHRTDEGDVHQRKDTFAGAFEANDYLSREDVEEADVL